MEVQANFAENHQITESGLTLYKSCQILGD